MNNTESKIDDVAVFFDFENIVYALRNGYNINANFEDLMDKCKEYGRVVVAHVFADWNRHSPSMTTALMSNGFDPVYVPTFYTDEDGAKTPRKNAVDMYMAIDAMDTLHNRKSVDTFILLTGDSDFVPLVNAIRREGNHVLAMGVDGAVSSNLAQAVDEFIFYSQLSDLPNSRGKIRPKDIYEGLVQSVKRLHKQKKAALLPNVKMMMAELLGGFDEKKHSDSKGRRFQKFKEFVQEAERKGLVKLHSSGSVNEIFLPNQPEPKSPVSKPIRSKSDRAAEKEKEKEVQVEKVEKVENVEGLSVSPTPEPLEINKKDGLTLEVALQLLVNSVHKAQSKKKSLRASSIKGIMSAEINGFDEKTLIMPEGMEPFQRFSEFTHAAAEQGLVVIKGESTRQEIHPVKKASKKGAAEAEEAESKPKKEKASKQESASPSKTTAIADAVLDSATLPEDYDARRLIVDALESFNNYPASFLQVESYCRNVRNKREADLSSTKIRSLMTEATRTLHLLKRTSPPGSSPALYEYESNDDMVAQFLGIPAESLNAAPQAAATEEEEGEGEEAGLAFELETNGYSQLDPNESVKDVEIAAPVFEVAPEAVEEPAVETGADEAETAEVEAVAEIADSTASKESEENEAGEPVEVEAEAAEESPQAEAEAMAEEAVEDQANEEPEPVETEPEPESSELTIAQAYRLLLSVVSNANEEGKSRKIRSIKTQMTKANPEFSETKLLNKNGAPFKRFVDFIRLAEEEGIVNVSGKGATIEISLVE